MAAIDEDISENCQCWKLTDKGFFKALECGSDWCKLYRGRPVWDRLINGKKDNKDEK